MTASSPTLMQDAGLAVAAYQRGDWAEAERLCRLILGSNADHFEALYLMGMIAGQTQRAPEAAQLLARAAALNPLRADVCNYLGIVLRELGRLDEALASHERVVVLAPEFAQAYNNCGVLLAELHRPEAALRRFDSALVQAPTDAQAHNNRANALRAVRRPEAALEGYAQAISLRPAYAEAHSNRGVALAELGRCEEAIASHDLAIALEPGYADAYSNRGLVLADLKRHAAALASYGRALALKPDAAPAHSNRALCLLQLGDYTRGWEEYEWRWHTGYMEQDRRDYVQPLWLGSPSLKGKTILLHSEQGLGDTLQFCRYAPLLAAMGARVVLEVQTPLVLLLAGLKGAAQVLARGAALPACDYHCPLLSLPLAFKTELNDIPLGIPYVASDAAHHAAWQSALGAKAKPRIGLAWSGRATHTNDRNRSMALAQLLPLLSADMEWISLQQEVRAADAPALAAHPEIRHYGDRLIDFADTAALVEQTDLVITVDSVVAHLAGAMGKPVWVLLPYNSDWRWLAEREDSPWYPTARLFRQQAIGDWAGVIRRIGAELARWRS